MSSLLEAVGLEHEIPEISPENIILDLPCIFCRHYGLCELWEDGRGMCFSFSRKL